MSGTWPLLVITGVTASGKTDLALRIAAQLPAHLISVDSAMVYRGMDIGTAKPTSEEQARHPHALIDIRDPAEAYTVADFVADADREVRLAQSTGRMPVLVGGTMMYLRAFRDGLDDIPASTPAVRELVSRRAAEEGWPALHAELMVTDPQAAASIHPNNPQRLARALEVGLLTGRPLSSYWGTAAGAAERLGCRVVEVWLDWPQRHTVHERIQRRLDMMFASGFVDEVARLHGRADLNPSMPSLRAVGYRQVWQYLDGQLAPDRLHEAVLSATRGLARRQYTWLRAWPHLHQLSAADIDRSAEQVVRLAIRQASGHSADETIGLVER